MSSSAQSTQTTTDAPSVPVDNDSPKNMSETLKEILDFLRGSSIAEERGDTIESKFWATYKKVSNEYDNDFLERTNDDMGIILTFAGLFSAVNSTFIIGMQPNPADTTNALMLQMINIMANGPDAVNISTLSSTTTYSSSTVWTLSLSYASLASSLLAAFGAVLGKQWLNSYKATRLQGSLEERGAQRQRRFDSLESWKFKAVLSTFLVLLQLSLFLFSLSLGANMWTQQTTISTVIICTTGFGFLFYMVTTCMSILFPHCPFRTAEAALIWKMLRAIFWAVVGVPTGLLPMLLFISSPIWSLACTVPLWALECVLCLIIPCVLGCVTVCESVLGRFFGWIPRIPFFLRVYRKCIAMYRSLGNIRYYTPGLFHARPHKSHTRLTVDSFIQSSSIRWLLETSTDPDVIDIAVEMMPLVQWTQEHDISAICARLFNSLATSHSGQKLFVKCRKIVARLCIQSVIIDKNVLLEAQDEGWINEDSIHDAFVAGRLAWETLKVLEKDDDRRKLEAETRTALRTMVVHGVQGMLSLPDDDDVIWDGDLRWYDNDELPSCNEFDWLVDYLVEKIDHKTDYVTQGDALLALSAMHGLGSDAKRAAYVKALIRCMESHRSRVRYAALRAVFNAREELSSITDDSMPDGIDAKLLDELSSALLTAVGNYTGMEATKYSPQDRCHLHLILALTKKDEWCQRFTRLGHVDQWTSLLPDLEFPFMCTFSPYIAGIYLQINPSGDHPALQKTWGKFMRHAWYGLDYMEPTDEGFGDCLEIIPALVTATKQSLRGSWDVPDLPKYVDHLLQTLQSHDGLRDDVLSAVQSFSDYLHQHPLASFGRSVEDSTV